MIVIAALAACAKAQVVVPEGQPDLLRQLRDDITAITRSPGVLRGVWAVDVRSISRNEPLVAINAETLMVPASVSKLVSAATAVDAVGWDYRYETTLRGTGPIVEGVLQGDLVVVGSGDPTIGGRAGDDLTTWIDALKAQGITRIAGRIVGDDDDLEDPRPQLSWAWDDLGYTSGALFGALNYGENRLTVTIEPTGPGLPTFITLPQYAAARPLGNSTITGPRGSMQLLWPEQRPGEPFLTIAGSMPMDAPPVRLGISAGNSTFWFVSVLRDRLINAGITVGREAIDIDDMLMKPDRGTATVLYTHRSRPLRDIIQATLKDSINLYGEALMRLNVPAGTFANNDAAIEKMEERLASWGIPRDAWQIIDGSGLSRRNTVAASVLVTVLQRMYDADAMSPWMAALPVAGRDGTLMTRMRGTPAEGNVVAKTGTMSNIRSLAGYVRTRDGEPLAFAVILDNLEGPGAAANDALDRIAARLASFSRN